MPAFFWSHTVWFILLGIGTVIQLVIVLKKAERRAFAFALYLAVCGMVFTIEAIIYCFLKSYEYYPMIFQQSPYDDGLAGNVFSQFSISATALTISVLNLRKRWIFIAAAIYALMEEIFLWLGIYRHYWYRTWITLIGLVTIFWLAGILYRKAAKELNTLLRYALVFFGLYTIDLPVIKWVFALNGIFLINMKLLPDELSSYSLIFLANLLINGIVCMIAYYIKAGWWWKAMLVSDLFILSYIALRLKLYGVREGWFAVFATVDILGTYLCTFMLDKMLGNRGNPWLAVR